jgi:WD40 repeat protein
LLAFGNDNAIEIWDVRTSEKTAEFINPKGAYATQFSFSEDGKRLYVILNRNREAQIWDTTSGKLIRQVKLTYANPNAFTAVALRAPLFARNNSDGNHGWIELWNLDEETFSKIDTPAAENEPLQFSPDGSLLAAGVRESGIHFWKTATGELIYQSEVGSYGLAISAENRLLAAGLDGRAAIYDLRPLLALSGQRGLPCNATLPVFARRGNTGPCTTAGRGEPVECSQSPECYASHGEGKIREWDD